MLFFIIFFFGCGFKQAYNCVCYKTATKAYLVVGALLN